jgi:hypothetical protein
VVFIFNLAKYYHTLQIGFVFYQIIELIIRLGEKIATMIWLFDFGLGEVGDFYHKY